mmetsp:Transcript_57504/g.168883  ORF Transcript_57504/g.168883 Transcript_57504/m.168883 type:complete len:275 (+) Transcript_57504:92-916(+)
MGSRPGAGAPRWDTCRESAPRADIGTDSPFDAPPDETAGRRPRGVPLRVARSGPRGLPWAIGSFTGRVTCRMKSVRASELPGASRNSSAAWMETGAGSMFVSSRPFPYFLAIRFGTRRSQNRKPNASGSPCSIVLPYLSTEASIGTRFRLKKCMGSNSGSGSFSAGGMDGSCRPGLRTGMTLTAVSDLASKAPEMMAFGSQRWPNSFSIQAEASSSFRESLMSLSGFEYSARSRGAGYLKGALPSFTGTSSRSILLRGTSLPSMGKQPEFLVSE